MHPTIQVAKINVKGQFHF